MTMQRAVVIGGSIAGLCAARVLADYFDRVTVLDRDADPAGPLDRAGVPQGRHVHALLARGRRDLERLFPGFEQRMVAAGAHEIDFGCDFATLRGASWAVREESGIRTLFASRTLLETIVRDLLRALPRVELVGRTEGTGRVAGRDGRARVRAVRLADGELPAELVIDATGRGWKAPDWLGALGLAPPAETLVDSHSGYATRWYRTPEPARWPAQWWWKGIWVDPHEPEHMTAGVLFPVEGGRWIVTIAGIAGHSRRATRRGSAPRSPGSARRSSRTRSSSPSRSPPSTRTAPWRTASGTTSAGRSASTASSPSATRCAPSIRSMDRA